MRIAWFTPFAPRSAIGTYSEQITAALAADGDDVTVFAPAGPDAPRACRLPVVPVADEVPALDAYDVAVYNVGDHLYNHLPVYEAATRHPGIVILHDVVMRDFFFGYFLVHRKDPAGFTRFLDYAHGPEAAAVGREVVEGRRAEPLDDPVRLRHPMFKPALHRALGVIVHSEYARRRVDEVSAVPVQAIDFPLFGPTAAAAAAPPPRRPAPGPRVRILTFGVVNPNKLVHATIEAIGKSPALRGGVEFKVIGQGGAEYDRLLRRRIAELRLDGVVELAGWQSDDALRAALTAADVVVNLRNPHMGESSASLLDSLVAGVPTVVWDHGFYAEFPDDVVVKVRAEGEIGPALEGLAGDPGRRRRMGAAARAHALERFDTARYCDRFRYFVEQVRRRAPLTALTDRVSDVLTELGSSALDGLAELFAVEMAKLVGGVEAAVDSPPAAEPPALKPTPGPGKKLTRPRIFRAA